MKLETTKLVLRYWLIFVADLLIWLSPIIWALWSHLTDLIRFSTSGYGLSFRGVLDITVLNYTIHYCGNFVAASLMAYSVLQGARCKYILMIVHCNHFILSLHFEVLQWWEVIWLYGWQFRLPLWRYLTSKVCELSVEGLTLILVHLHVISVTLGNKKQQKTQNCIVLMYFFLRFKMKTRIVTCLISILI